jgi:hypothetical protein
MTFFPGSKLAKAKFPTGIHHHQNNSFDEFREEE